MFPGCTDYTGHGVGGAELGATGAGAGERVSEDVSAEQGCVGVSRKVLGRKAGVPKKLSGLELERIGIRAGQPG